LLRRAGPGDCPELCRRRVELELALQVEGTGYERCVKTCRSMLGKTL
jgi:hypothetical protein